MNGNFEAKSSGGSRAFFRQFNDALWRPLIHSPARSSVVLFFLLSLLVGAFLSTRFLDSSPIVAISTKPSLLTDEAISNISISIAPPMKTEIPLKDTNSLSETTPTPEKPRLKTEFPLECSGSNITQTCPRSYPEKTEVNRDAPPPSTCPDYFRWIYEDLRPWKETGITRDMLEILAILL